MIGDSGTSRNGDKHHYYTCYTRKSRRRTGETCKKKSEQKEFLEWYVIQQVKEYILDNRRIEIITDAIIKNLKRCLTAPAKKPSCGGCATSTVKSTMPSTRF